jgi:hypothetical protein
MKKIFIAGLSLSALLFTGCHTPNESSHSQTGSLFVSADNHRNKQPLPRTELRSTEIPKVVISGFGGSQIVLELWKQDGVLLARQNFAVPESRTTREDHGIVYAQGFEGMRPVHRVDVLTTRAGIIVQLKPLPPGAYEVRLLLENAVRQSVSFRVTPG